jgi:hypothetical protein
MPRTCHATSVRRKIKNFAAQELAKLGMLRSNDGLKQKQIYENNMHHSRDFYQRKVYAVQRMNLAIIRESKGKTNAEKRQAAFWVAAWAAISGLRQFKIERKIRS